MWSFKRNILRTVNEVDDTTPPTVGVLTVLRAPNDCHVAALTWTAATDNVAVTGYEVWRGNTGSEVLVATLGNVLSYEDGSNPWAIMSTSFYKIKAKDAAGNTSGYSNMDSEVMSGWENNFSSPGRESSAQACLESSFPTVWYSNNAFHNTQLFTNNNLTTPANGNDLWYQEGIEGISYQIDTSGNPSAGITC